MAIVIDANTLLHSLIDTILRDAVLQLSQALYAPKIIVSEVTAQQYKFALTGKLKPRQVESVIKDMFRKITLRIPSRQSLQDAYDIINDLSLDMGDAEYIALCCEYQKQRPTFWTQDKPFVIGPNANILRTKYGIFPNFNPRP